MEGGSKILGKCLRDRVKKNDFVGGDQFFQRGVKNVLGKRKKMHNHCIKTSTLICFKRIIMHCGVNKVH